MIRTQNNDYSYKKNRVFKILWHLVIWNWIKHDALGRIPPFHILAHKYVVLNENAVETKKQQDKLTYQHDNNILTIINDIFSELDRWDRWRLAVTDFTLDDTSFRIAAPNITSKHYKLFKILIGSCFELGLRFWMWTRQCCLSNPQSTLPPMHGLSSSILHFTLGSKNKDTWIIWMWVERLKNTIRDGSRTALYTACWHNLYHSNCLTLLKQ